MHFCFFHLNEKSYCVSFVYSCGLFHEVGYDSDCAASNDGVVNKQ